MKELEPIDIPESGLYLQITAAMTHFVEFTSSDIWKLIKRSQSSIVGRELRLFRCIQIVQSLYNGHIYEMKFDPRVDGSDKCAGCPRLNPISSSCLVYMQARARRK